MSRKHNACPHLRKTLYRVIASNGRNMVVEQCLECGENARGSGVWVPHAQVAVPVESLPVLADRRERPAPEGSLQMDLFGDLL